MNSIAHEAENANYTSGRISRFFSRYHISEILKESNAYKEKGFSVVTLVMYLFCLVFRGRSIYTDMELGKTSFAKDTVYRFQNSIHTNWTRFTTLLSARIIKDTISPLTSDKRKNVFIIDDSIYERERSKRVELLCWSFDHAKRHDVVKGFRMLTLTWSDGVSNIPVNFCMMSTEKSEKVLVPAKKVSSTSNGARRREQAQKKMTDVVPELVRTALDAKIAADYALFDSWFSSPKEIAAIKALNLDVVAMVKKSSTTHYLYNGQMMDCMQIYDQNKKRRGRSKYLLSVEVTVCTKDENGDEVKIPAKLVYVRNRTKRKEYLVLLSTDTAMTEDEVIQIYSRRWDIEVFFKTCKSLLKLTTENRSVSYDGICAHTAIVFARYMFLAVERRENEDLRSEGPLFCLVASEIPEISVDAAFEKLQLFMKNLLQEINISEEQISVLENRMMEVLPAYLAELLGINATFRAG